MVPDYIKTYNKIYGPNLHFLKVKAVRIQLTIVVADYILVSPGIMKKCMDVTVSIGIIYVNKLVFIVSTSCRIRFITMNYVNYRYKAMIMKSIKKFFNLYSKRKFKVVTLLVDRCF